jgi:hypothetical protein
MSKSWTIEVQKTDDGEFFIELNDEILAESGFKVGDDIEWVDNKDGSFTLQKSDKVWVLVDAVQTFRTRYLVQTPADHPEYALDTVACEKAKEFSQEYLGETIVSHRVISHDDALRQLDADNSYLKNWTEEQKYNAAFTFEKDLEDE